MTKAARASEKKDLLAAEFLRYLTVERNASPRTLKAYRQALTAFQSTINKPWKKCAPNDFRDYLFGIMKAGQARSYVRLQFSALRTFYQFLAARKGLRTNPARDVQLPKIEKKLPLVLTRQQIDELLAAVAYRRVGDRPGPDRVVDHEQVVRGGVPAGVVRRRPELLAVERVDLDGFGAAGRRIRIGAIEGVGRGREREVDRDAVEVRRNLRARARRPVRPRPTRCRRSPLRRARCRR